MTSTIRGDGRSRPERSDARPSWRWVALCIGLATGLFGVLILITGALMSETGTPRGGDFIEVTQYQVSDWLFWLGAACVVFGTILSWPGYRVAFGRRASMPVPTWMAPALITASMIVSAIALPVARAAAPHSGLRNASYQVTAVVWLFGLACAIGAAINRARQGSSLGSEAGGPGSVDPPAAPSVDEQASADAPQPPPIDDAGPAPTDRAPTPFTIGTDDPRQLTESGRDDLRRRWPPG